MKIILFLLAMWADNDQTDSLSQKTLDKKRSCWVDVLYFFFLNT